MRQKEKQKARKKDSYESFPHLALQRFQDLGKYLKLELQGATHPSISKHGDPHKEMKDLELLPFLPLSHPFQSFGG